MMEAIMSRKQVREKVAELLKAHYPEKSAIEIAKMAGTTDNTVHAVRRDMGIEPILKYNKYEKEEIINKVKILSENGYSKAGILSEINKKPGNCMSNNILNKILDKYEIKIVTNKEMAMLLKKNDELSMSGAQCKIDGSYYKIARGLVWMWNIDEWRRSTRSVEDIEKHIRKMAVKYDA